MIYVVIQVCKLLLIIIIIIIIIKIIIVFALFRKVSSMYINECVSLFKQNTKHVIIPSAVYIELLQLLSNLQRR